MAVTKIGEYAFYYHPNLETVRTSATTIETSAFLYASKLNTVDFTSASAVTIGTTAFSSTPLVHLIVRSSSISTLSSSNCLSSTNIARGDGAIYVPANLLNSYKSASNWTVYKDNIYPIEEYPKTTFDTISDSWSTILSNASYSTNYNVKDTKTLELSDGTMIKMGIAAFDTDDKSDDSGKAKITWISSVCLPERPINNAVSSNTWLESDIRTWLTNDVLPKIPSEIRSHIVSVKKTYYSAIDTSTLISNDLLWIPSGRECGYTGTAVENSGPIYNVLLGTTALRSKHTTISQTNAKWWTRTQTTASTVGGGSSIYELVTNTGGFSSENSHWNNTVCFGFCTD